MKPHLRKLCGLWYCGLIGEFAVAWGIGYTPAHAYSDWYELQAKVKRA